MRLSLVVATGLISILTAVATASAAPPTRSPLGPTDGTLEGVCPFPLGFTDLQNTQVVTVFSDGRTTVTGAYKSRVTNLVTGKFVDINAPGPITITPNADGTLTVTGRGKTLFFFFPGDLGPGRPGALLHMTGLVVERVSGDFTQILSFQHSGGTTEDLCHTLA
jgi:hypothetical protein